MLLVQFTDVFFQCYIFVRGSLGRNCMSRWTCAIELVKSNQKASAPLQGSLWTLSSLRSPSLGISFSAGRPGEKNEWKCADCHGELASRERVCDHVAGCSSRLLISEGRGVPSAEVRMALCPGVGSGSLEHLVCLGETCPQQGFPVWCSLERPV